VLDCVSKEASYKLIAKALPNVCKEPAAVKFVTLLPTDTWPRHDDIKPVTILAYTTLGKAFSKFGVDLPAIPSHFDFGVRFWKLSNELLAQGRVKTHPIALREGGLAGIPDG
jgi:hypothetical protein